MLARGEWRPRLIGRGKRCKLKNCTLSFRRTGCGTSVKRSSTTTSISGGMGIRATLIVCDDSSPVAQEKYYPLLEQTSTHNELLYVGPREKEQFLGYLSRRLRDKRLDGLVKNLFRPSYGGNRNYTLMYTLGGLMVSSDDDMRPYALMEHSLESLGDGEVSRGRLHRAGQNGYGRKSFDIIGSFLDVLGKKADDVPDNYEKGEVLVDTAMDLETNASKGLARENSVLIERGPVPARRRREDGADISLRDERHRRNRFRRSVPRRRGPDRPRRPERALRARQLPAGGDQEELADGLRRGGI